MANATKDVIYNNTIDLMYFALKGLSIEIKHIKGNGGGHEWALEKMRYLRNIATQRKIKNKQYLKNYLNNGSLTKEEVST